MRKYRIEFEEEANIENPERYQDFDGLLNKRQRYLTKRSYTNKIITIAAMLLVPVVFALGYMNQNELLKLFSKKTYEQVPEPEPVPEVVKPRGEIVPKEEKPPETVKEIKEELVAENSELEPGKDIVTSATPKGGIEGLKTYFSDIVIYSDDDQESKYSEITVAFWINKQGIPESINVIEKLRPKVESQVIEAVKNMPEWHPAKVQGTPSRSMISFKIRFKMLPKATK